MPHINRIRVNNVRYNFGTQFYDDFVMRFDCRNVLYDLANGGGKSVLLLLLLQNLIPNCTLDDKQPVEKLFRGEHGSTVIHSLIEWKLEDALVRDEERYMLTGFCARKAKEEEGQNAAREMASIEYFNYVVFYRHYNDNDLVNLPLSDGKERVTYAGLKTYLKNLPKKDYQLRVHIFERKGEYQRFISQYGLYESEWEIIRGINKTEGHVRAYFENHYRTTRKVVEDLLIEEIIQKAFAMRTADDGKEAGDAALMADTLYEIKDQLAELTRRQAELHHYDQQQAVLQSLGERIRTLDKMYQEEAELYHEMGKTYRTSILNGRIRARNLAVAEKEKEKAESQAQEYARKLETVRVQLSREQLETLEEKSTRLQASLDALSRQQAAKRENLNLRESMNDYLMYLEEQQQYQAIAHAIRHAADGQQEQLRLLRAYAAEWGRRYKARCHELDGRLLEGKQTIHLNNSQKAILGEEERETDRMLAVLEHQLEEERAREKDYLKQFGKLREQSGLLIIEEIGKHLREQRRQMDEKTRLLQAMADQRASASEALQKAELRFEQLEPELAQIRERLAEQSGFMADWKAQRERMRKLLTVYHVQDGSALKAQLFERYRRLSCELEEQQERQRALEKTMKELAEGNPLTAPEDVCRFMEYIRTCHGLTCVYGAEYLKDLTSEEQKQLMERIPILPYTVIVKEGFSRLAADTLLQEKDFGPHPIPVTGLEMILSETAPVDGDALLVAGKGSSYFLDERVILREQRRCEEERTGLTRQIARLQDQMLTYQKDMEDVSVYLLLYEGQKDQRQRLLAEAEAQEQKLLEEQTRMRQELQQRTEELAALEAQMLAETEKLTAAEKQYGLLQQLQTVNDGLTEARKALAEEQQKHEQLTAKKTEQLQQLAALERSNDELSARCETAARQKEGLVQEWTKDWQLYAGEAFDDRAEVLTEMAEKPDGAQAPAEDDGAAAPWQAMSDEELRAAFAGVRVIYEKEHLDLTDKKQLMENYSRSMERLLKAVTDRNHRQETLARMYREGQLYQTDAEALREQKDEVAALEDEIDRQRHQLADMEANRNRLYGSVTQAVTVLEEKYGAYKEVTLNDQNYESYVENMARLSRGASDRLEEAKASIERLTRESYVMEGLRKDLERLMSLCHLPLEVDGDTWGQDVNLKRKYEELLNRHEQLRSRRMARREAFEKDRARAVSSLELLGAAGLAAEIREHLILPEDARAAGQVMADIEETIQLIDIEKERVGKNMEELTRIRESFEAQCLQICQNIRMELDKLPKMSVITMGDEQIQMVGLTIPYVKEAFWEQQMNTYIDEIVKTADSFGTQEEKLRYIRQQLAWKRLFAVIVTDMNAIRLTLYKRERIAAQSRYLRYEEAVGSTGQSQGIYIQFLIAIIHYISCVHAGTSSGSALKKVIFIDNPFGAAKDIYIWEPIFALLKTNDVQLIVPARGATPAITGKFDVNYVLGQKLMNNRQQTIVADYHSNVMIEEVEYIRMNYEQEVFDFV